MGKKIQPLKQNIWCHLMCTDLQITQKNTLYRENAVESECCPVHERARGRHPGENTLPHAELEQNDSWTKMK